MSSIRRATVTVEIVVISLTVLAAGLASCNKVETGNKIEPAVIRKCSWGGWLLRDKVTNALLLDIGGELRPIDPSADVNEICPADAESAQPN